MSNAADQNETVNKAVSAALSIHYIAIALYSLGALASVLFVFASLITDTGIDMLQAALLLFMPILFSSHLLAVKGLRRAKPWGHKTSKVLACVLLLGFPFGTVLGIILLSELSKFSFTYELPT